MKFDKNTVILHRYCQFYHPETNHMSLVVFINEHAVHMGDVIDLDGYQYVDHVIFSNFEGNEVLEHVKSVFSDTSYHEYLGVDAYCKKSAYDNGPGMIALHIHGYDSPVKAMKHAFEIELNPRFPKQINRWFNEYYKQALGE